MSGKERPDPISPTEYGGYTCVQLVDEMRGLSKQVSLLTGQIDEEADADAWQMGVGMVLFWPALFFLEGGDGAQAQEYAELKGRYSAVETQYKRTNCGESTRKPVQPATNAMTGQ